MVMVVLSVLDVMEEDIIQLYQAPHQITSVNVLFAMDLVQQSAVAAMVREPKTVIHAKALARFK